MRTWWWLWVLAGLPLAAAAQVRPPTPAAETAPVAQVTRQTLATVVHALGKGDVPTLARLYERPPDPVTRVLAAMALERIHFNLDQATRDARICEDSLIGSQPGIALFCAEFANGNVRLTHGERAADADEADIVRRFAGKVPDDELDGLRHYLASRRNVPSMQIHRPPGTFVIPLGRKADSDMQTLTVEANGTSLPLVIDTGSPAVVLDANWARKLGVHMTDRSSTARGVLARGIRVRHGMLDKLGFGGVTLEHVPVVVVPGQQRLIGLDALRTLGIFRLASGKLTVYGASAAVPVCRQPMLVASDLWGHDLKTLTAVSVNGTLYTPPVDSGSSGFLMASQAAMVRLKSGSNTRVIMRDMGPRTHDTRVNWSTAMVRIAGQLFQVTLPVFKDARVPWDFLLGTRALDYMDFYFDFTHHHTCMLIHGSM